MGGGKPWTEEENDFLINGAKGLKDEEIAELLGRTTHSIWGHRNFLRKQGKITGNKEKEYGMNVAYDQINCSDAAKRIGVTIACIQRWCRDGIINFINVSDGTERARYLLEEDEVAYLQDLVKKFGVRKAMLWYRKDKNTRQPKPYKSAGDFTVIKEPVVEKKVPVKVPNASILNTDNRLQQVMPKVEAPNTSEPCKTEEQIIAEKATKAILYIQDIKARLADLEKEKALLLKELEECKQEVMGLL